MTANSFPYDTPRIWYTPDCTYATLPLAGHERTSLQASNFLTVMRGFKCNQQFLTLDLPSPMHPSNRFTSNSAKPKTPRFPRRGTLKVPDSGLSCIKTEPRAKPQRRFLISYIFSFFILHNIIIIYARLAEWQIKGETVSTFPLIVSVSGWL